MCHHYETDELAEWERLRETESDEEPDHEERELDEEPERATPPADD